jgi:hypothetical protein
MRVPRFGGPFRHSKGSAGADSHGSVAVLIVFWYMRPVILKIKASDSFVNVLPLLQDEVRKWADWLNEQGYEILHAKPRFSKSVRKKQGKIPPSRRKSGEKENEEKEEKTGKESETPADTADDEDHDGDLLSDEGDGDEEADGNVEDGVLVLDAPSPPKGADAPKVDGS